MPVQTWRELFALIEQRIRDGTYPPGMKLPTIADLTAREGSSVIEGLISDGTWSKANIERAYRELAAYGLVVQRPRTGTIVRDTSVIAVPLSRYSKVLEPGGTRGPWETATAELGLDGQMIALGVEQLAAPAEVAEHLDLPQGDPVVLRRRHAMIGSDVVQLQSAWYPLDVAQAAGLDQAGKVTGGALGAMKAAGLVPYAGDETVQTRLPTKAEAAELGIGMMVPVLLIDRVTRDGDDRGRPIELVQIVATGDRVKLIYQGLRLDGHR
jgi:GntR family transcriptional regulator